MPSASQQPPQLEGLQVAVEEVLPHEGAKSSNAAETATNSAPRTITLFVAIAVTLGGLEKGRTEPRLGDGSQIAGGAFALWRFSGLPLRG